jgi:hypothetical protein
VQIPNPGGNLVEGAYASARLVLRQVEGIVVPRAALNKKAETVTLVLAEDSKARRVPVQVLFQTELEAVVEGIPVGSTVVVSGGDQLQDGRLLELRREEGSQA